LYTLDFRVIPYNSSEGMNYKNYDNNDKDKSYEREFAERVKLLGYAEAYDELIALITTAQRTALMGDPNAIVTFVAGAAISPILRGEVYKLIQTVFEKTVEQASELLTKEIKYFEIQRTIDVLISIDSKLKNAGINPQKVNLHKILIPAFQAISIEDNPAIQEMYVNLLAAAIAGEGVDVKDIATLKLLESNDILVLEALYYNGNSSCRGDFVKYKSGVTREQFESAVDGLVAQGIIESTTLQEAVRSIEIALTGITSDKGVAEYTRPGDPMLDLEFIQKSFQNALKKIVEAQTIDKYDSIKFTNRGWEFMQKCKGILTKSVEAEQNL
jgi:hypothetical protein